MKPTAYPRSRRLGLRRKALMFSCGSLAMATAALAPQRAHAQAAPTGAFHGTITGTTGTVTRTPTSNTTETITIGSGTATIDWAPNNAGTGTITFLPDGNIATFTSTPGLTTYTVLNRVVPTGPSRSILIDGDILSFIEGGSTRGGNIWFYSPGGILIGANATLDVGSLLLTTLDVTSFGVDGSGFTASFAPADGVSPGAIQVMSGAQINAVQQNSYVAMVAPRVVQGGTVDVNGSAAYVAAEQLTMTMNQGLFDIAIDVGSADTNGIVHTGTTTGDGNATETDNHRIYMVAVPKNDAVSMLLDVRGNVGFRTMNASVENGVVVLSAGHNVFNGDGNAIIFDQVNPFTASVSIGAGNYGSDVIGIATTEIGAYANAGAVAFADDLDLHAVSGAARLSASGGNALAISGSAELSSDREYNPDAEFAPSIDVYAGSGGSISVGEDLDLDATDQGGGGAYSRGGNIYVNADGGDIHVTGTIYADASAFGGTPDGEGPSSDSEGGFVHVRAADGGTVTAGRIDADVSGHGGYTNFQGGIAGDGTGGIFYMLSETGGAITVNGSLDAHAFGFGGTVFSHGDATGTGTGGTAFIRAQGGTINVAGTVTLVADGHGGSVIDAATAVGTDGGAGIGGGGGQSTGGAGIATNSDTSAVTIGGDLYLSATGFGGHGHNGGQALGGDSGIRSNAGSIAITGLLDFDSYAVGGNATVGFGGTGGSAQGGTAYIQAELSQGTTSSISGGNVQLEVGASGGTGGAGNGDNIAAGAGGNAVGGTHTGPEGSGGAHVIADSRGAVLTLGNVDAYANAHGGTGGMGGSGQAGGAGGTATGGTVTAGTFNPNTANTAALADVTFGNLVAFAGGYGGDGGAGNAGQGGLQGIGGAAYGGGHCGLANTCGGILIGARGAVEMADARLLAHGWGGDGSTGGNGVGGDVTVLVRPGGSLTIADDLELSTTSWGGYGSDGSGGSAIGGWSGMFVDAASVNVGGTIDINSAAIGGGAGIVSGFSGGAAQGGTAYLSVGSGGSVEATDIFLWTAGHGGAGVSQGGAGTGGSSTIVSAGSVSAAIIRAQAFGYGGFASAGAGGAATGGDAAINLTAGSDLTYASELVVDTFASAGGGTTQGGAASGGDSALSVSGGIINGTGTIIVGSAAHGGNATGAGSTGGSAAGGNNSVSVTNGAQVTTAGFLNLNAAAYGGTGVAQGGTATGGTSTVFVNAANMLAGSMGIYANAWGGSGMVGGDALGGSANVTLGTGGGLIDVAGVLGIEGMGFGGAGSANAGGTGGTGGVGQGNSASFYVAAGTVEVGSVYAEASGVGGAGGSGDIGGLGGDGTGGTASFSVDGALTATTANDSGAFSVGIGGAGGVGTTTGGNGGAGFGGNADTEIAGTVTGGVYYAWTRGNGGHGGSGPTAGDGGDSQGGFSSLDISGSVNVDGLLVNATAFGGNGANGGDATGGESTAMLSGNVTSANSLQVTAQGLGGAGSSGVGGNGLGGSSELDVTGNVSINWLFMGNGGFGGNGVTGGGNAFGGSSLVSIIGDMSVATYVEISPLATAGNASAGDGGYAQAGTAELSVSDGGSLTATDVRLLANAIGGNGAGGGNGGDAYGGYSHLAATAGGTLNSATLTVRANGTGGSGATAGTGSGSANIEGWGGAIVEANGSGALLNVTGLTIIEASGFGGNGTVSGNGLGGFAGLYAVNGGDVQLGSAMVRADGTGGSGAGGDGGDGSGGMAEIFASGVGSSLTVANVTPFMTGYGLGDLLSAQGFGGQNNGGGDLVGGTGTGGTVNLRSESGASITLPNNPTTLTRILARGTGGNTSAEGGTGGTGFGGTINLGVDNATMTATNILPSNFGQGGHSALNTINASGGDGFGGVRNIYAHNGGVLTISTPGGTTGGLGGDGSGTGNGGDGSGGAASLSVDTNGEVIISGTLSILSQASGGSGATAGSATGGTATVSVTNGGTISGAGTADNLYVGGVAFHPSGTIGGGVATGSTVQVTVDSMSSIDIGGELRLLADAYGAAATTGTGGAAYGGTATLQVDGSVTAGTVVVSAVGRGGSGTSGGYGQGGSATVNIGSGGTLSSAVFNLVADGFGGDATTGVGGNAYAGSAIVHATGEWNATGDVFVSAEGEGGDGGSAGGSGSGGNAAVRVFDGGVATLTGNVNVLTTGQGGASANGAGGDGIGGYARMSAYVGETGGTITANTVTVNSSGFGGNGVSGGDGIAQPSVEGWGGSVIQTIDAGSSIVLTGQTNVLSNGIGGTGTTGAGGAGTGGYASVAGHTGAPLTFQNALIRANGTGGAGGAGTGAGEGGATRLGAFGAVVSGNSAILQSNGTTAGGLVEVGALNGGSLSVGSLTATANGGSFAGDVLVEVDATSSMTFGMFQLYSAGNVAQNDEDGIELDSAGTFTANQVLLASSDDIRIGTSSGGTINVAGVLEANSAGRVRLLDDGAGGPITANVLDVSSANGIVSTASLAVANLYFATAVDLVLGDMSASETLSLASGGNLTTGNLVSGGELYLDAATAIQTGTLTATGNVEVEAGGNFTFQSADVGSLDFDVGGGVTGGNIAADIYVTGESEGAILLGNITVGPGPEPIDDFSVGISSATSITVGNVSSYGRVGFATLGDLVADDIQAGSLIMALVGGDITVGSMTTAPGGTIYLADASMFIDAGGGSEEDDFDVTLVLAAAPVATEGAIAIGGPVSTGTFRANAGTTLSAGEIDASGQVELVSGGNLDIGNASAGQAISLTSGGNLDTGVLEAPVVSLSVAGDFTTGDLFAEETLLLSAGGDLTTGNIVVGGDLGLEAGGDLLTANLTAGGNIALGAGGSIVADDVSAGGAIAASAGTTLTLGAVQSGFVPPPPPPEQVAAQAVAQQAATGENIVLSSTGNMEIGSISSAEGITLTSGGTMTTGALDAVAEIAATSTGAMDLEAALAGGELSLKSGAALVTGDLAGSAVAVEAAGPLTVGAVEAETTAEFTSGGLASFLAAVSAPEITVTSRDIHVADGASLGVHGVTELLTLNARSSSPVVLGGDETDASAGQYQLAEAGDIEAEAIVINAVAASSGGSAPDIHVLDVEIDGGTTNSVTVNTTGVVVVEGAVEYVNADSDDELVVNAGDAIEIVTNEGGISITDADGDVTGELVLTADNIWIASSTIIDQLEANPNFAGRNAALATNSGSPDPDGKVRAGAVTANVSDTLLVQNSGTADEPSGLTVGDGGLTVNNRETDPATVVIYGEQEKSDGSVVGGEEFVESVEFTGGGFAEESTVNGCEFEGCAPEQAPIPGGAESVLGPIEVANETSTEPPAGGDEGGEGDDGEEGEEEEGGDDGESSVDPSIQLINTTPMQPDTSVDEPVTSGSDSPGGMN